MTINYNSEHENKNQHRYPAKPCFTDISYNTIVQPIRIDQSREELKSTQLYQIRIFIDLVMYCQLLYNSFCFRNENIIPRMHIYQISTN